MLLISDFNFGFNLNYPILKPALLNPISEIRNPT